MKKLKTSKSKIKIKIYFYKLFLKKLTSKIIIFKFL